MKNIDNDVYMCGVHIYFNMLSEAEQCTQFIYGKKKLKLNHIDQITATRQRYLVEEKKKYHRNTILKNI